MNQREHLFTRRDDSVCGTQRAEGLQKYRRSVSLSHAELAVALLKILRPWCQRRLSFLLRLCSLVGTARRGTTMNRTDLKGLNVSLAYGWHQNQAAQTVGERSVPHHCNIFNTYDAIIRWSEPIKSIWRQQEISKLFRGWLSSIHPGNILYFQQSSQWIHSLHISSLNWRN